MSTTAYDAARAAQFFADRLDFTTGTHELDVRIREGAEGGRYQVIDVRFPDDYAEAHVPGAINLPMAKWDNRRFLAEHLDRDATLYVYCYSPTCHLAAQAAAKLVRAGYRVVEVEGGWEDWVAHGYPTETVSQAKSA
jgi:rhodanese-related sulfurtransferase